MITKLIEEALAVDDIANIITIEVAIEPVLDEDLERVPVSRTLTLMDIIDDITFDQWSNFESAIREYIRQNFILEGVTQNGNVKSLSEYIDFYVLDENGDKKETIINLRLSNHRGTNNQFRVKKLKQRTGDVNQKYRLIGVTVNGETFNSYKEAFKYAKDVIDETADTI